MMRAENVAPLRLDRAPDLCGLRCESRVMRDVVTTSLRVARSEVPVLITGPSGSGKELLAEIIQRNSRRADRPFVRVNAGAIPEALFEAELFGVEPGAYTGATRLRAGLLARAAGGTLFLDEIGNLAPAGQAKLLRVLQDGDYQRLGSDVTRHADVRLITATNADLESAVAAGTFREDLYYRLDVVRLRVPPLCARREDIVPIAEQMLESSVGEGPRSLSPAARLALATHGFPGNVRELHNRLLRARLLADGPMLEPHDLGLPIARPMLAPAPASAAPPALRSVQSSVQSSGPSVAPFAGPSAQQLDRCTLEGVLSRARGNITRAAAHLGISRQAFYRAMTRVGVDAPRRITAYAPR